MSRLLVRRGGESWEIAFQGEALLSEVLRRADLSPAQPCGGRGVCG